MRITRNEDGYLFIERGGRMIEQFCPFAPLDDAGYQMACGDWCPLFCEPFTTPTTACIYLECAPHLVTFSCPVADFTDLRK